MSTEEEAEGDASSTDIPQKGGNRLIKHGSIISSVFNF